MKSAAPVVAFAAVVAAQPTFTNTAFDVEEGKPFTLTFNGCQGGCSIVLQNGPEDDLQDVRELTSSASGGSFTVTLDDLPTDQYAFKIVNNASGEDNYSVQFSYAGSGEPEETSSSVEATTFTTTRVTTSTSEPTTTSANEESTTETIETETTETETVTTGVTTETSATPTASTTETDSETTTSSDDAEATESSGIPDPDGAAGAIGAPLSLIAAAVASLLFFQ